MVKQYSSLSLSLSLSLFLLSCPTLTHFLSVCFPLFLLWSLLLYSPIYLFLPSCVSLACLSNRHKETVRKNTNDVQYASVYTQARHLQKTLFLIIKAPVLSSEVLRAQLQSCFVFTLIYSAHTPMFWKTEERS